MGSYTDFKSSAKHRISYHYTCQHCGMESPVHHVTVEGIATKRKSGRVQKLDFVEQRALDEKAMNNLRDNIRLLRNDTESGLFEANYFDGKCPNCGKHQKWSGGSAFVYIFTKNITLSLSLGIWTFVIVLFLGGSRDWDTSTLFTYPLLAAAICYGIGVVVNAVRYFAAKLNSRGGKGNSLPIIDWNGM